MSRETTWNDMDSAKVEIPKWVCESCRAIKSEKVYSLDHEEIGAAVRQRRERSGMSLRSMAKWMGFSAMHLSNLERGLRKWSVQRISDATDILDMYERTNDNLRCKA